MVHNLHVVHNVDFHKLVLVVVFLHSAAAPSEALPVAVAEPDAVDVADEAVDQEVLDQTEHFVDQDVVLLTGIVPAENFAARAASVADQKWGGGVHE